MTAGLTRAQLGVTQEMIAGFGDMVWELSHNLQVRRGDPVRLLDFAEIEAQRPGTGMTDAQIAARVGLSPEQVLFIRLFEERRRFRRRHYHRLYDLGGGRRYRHGKTRPPEERPAFSEDALALRRALAFAPDRARAYVETGWWAGDTLTGWLAERAAGAADRPAILAPGLTLTWSELAVRVDRLAGGLDALGIARGEVVAVQLPNLPEYLICYLAIAALGGVLCPLHMAYRERECRAQLAHSRARAVICLDQDGSRAPAAMMLALKGELPSLGQVIAVGQAPDGAVALGGLMEGKAAPVLDFRPVGADPFLLGYTSGTTAAPKAVPIAYQQFLGNARLSAKDFGLTADDVILSAAPMTHLFGLYGFHLALATGAANLLLPAFSPQALVETIAKDRPTLLLTAPAHLAACLEAGLLKDGDLDSLRFAIVSGAASPPGLVRAIDAMMPNGRLGQLWGMTETQAALYTRPENGVEVSATSAGRPGPGTEIRLVDGELQVRGASVFAGYFDNPAANAAAFTEDGWFRTGDLAVLDKDGNVAITGRTTDLINRGGVKINPADVEVLIDAYPKIVRSALVPMPDPVLGERACCFAVAADGAEPTLEELCAWLEEQGVSKQKLPERLELVADLPLTPTGKVIKAKLVPEGGW